MMRLQWDSSIALGVPRLDADHKRLIGLYNFLNARQEKNVDSETISLVIEQIREFASSHFPREEMYMAHIGYPGQESHKKLHKAFREQTAALCIDIMNHKQTAPQDILQLLHAWVTEHILQEDLRIQAFQRAKTACNCDAVSL